jgi:hypothetical protein
MDPFPETAKASEILAAIRSDVYDFGLVFATQPRGAERWWRSLTELSDEELLGAPVKVSEMASCVRSGLLLRADLFEASHTLSQSIETREGSYWHGILHRREPDYSNAKYWFHKVGRHAAFDDIAAQADAVAQRTTVAMVAEHGHWDPFAFIDLCEACERRDSAALRRDLLALQELEIEVLLAHCYRRAVGRGKA